MELIIVLGLLVMGLWSTGRLLCRAIRSFSNRTREQANPEPPGNRQNVSRLHQQRDRQVDLNKKYRELQVALLQISQAPDFQRAASRAEAAQAIPLASRQRQYRRFRPQLVRHFAKRLRAGTDSQILLDSLTALVDALGVASFEASYIQQEATRQGQPQPASENFSVTLERMQQEHAERTAALNQATLDPETKQQLLEAQSQRLVESLMEMTLSSPGGTA